LTELGPLFYSSGTADFSLLESRNSGKNCMKAVAFPNTSGRIEMHCLADSRAARHIDPDDGDRHGAGHGGDDPHNDCYRAGVFVGSFQERLLGNPYQVSTFSL